MRRVVVTGMGVISPIGNSIDEFYASLQEGKSGIGPLTKFADGSSPVAIAAEVKNFDPVAQGISFKNIRDSDLFSLYGEAAARQAMKQAGLESLMSNDENPNMGVILGTGVGGLMSIEKGRDLYSEKGIRRVPPSLVPTIMPNTLAGRVSILYKANGHTSSESTACATGIFAIGSAYDKIKYGSHEIMLAGGSEAAITPLSVGSFAKARALCTNHGDQTASRPFDKDRSGFVIGEGAAVLVLEEYGYATARGAKILAEIVDYSTTSDGFHITAPHPDGRHLERAIRDALKKAGIIPSEVGYINAHGTSTPLNDKVESEVLYRVFGGTPWVSSTKGMTGHLLGAASAVESVACIFALEKGIPPNINLIQRGEDISPIKIATEFIPTPVKISLNTTAGFGGHNGAMLFKQYEG